MSDCQNCHRFDFVKFGNQVDTIQFLEVLVSSVVYEHAYRVERQTWCAACWDAARNRTRQGEGQWTDRGRLYRGDNQIRISLLGGGR